MVILSDCEFEVEKGGELNTSAELTAGAIEVGSGVLLRFWGLARARFCPDKLLTIVASETASISTPPLRSTLSFQSAGLAASLAERGTRGAPSGSAQPSSTQRAVSSRREGMGKGSVASKKVSGAAPGREGSEGWRSCRQSARLLRRSLPLDSGYRGRGDAASRKGGTADEERSHVAVTGFCPSSNDGSPDVSFVVERGFRVGGGEEQQL